MSATFNILKIRSFHLHISDKINKGITKRTQDNKISSHKKLLQNQFQTQEFQQIHVPKINLQISVSFLQ